MNFHVYVISAGRPGAVAKLAPHLDDVPHTWVIPEDQRYDYWAAHSNLDRGPGPGLAPRFSWLPDGGSLVAARNVALDAAFGRDEACVQLSDDLKRIKALPAEEYTLAEALWALDAALDDTGLALCGCSPTDNLYFAKPGISTRKFVVGDLIMVRPTELRFDPELSLKEDYDFTLQHWMTYGGAARCDYIAPSFSHYTNAGGAVAARTVALEQATIAYLKDKWPGLIRDNPRRPNEILLTTPRRHR